MKSRIKPVFVLRPPLHQIVHVLLMLTFVAVGIYFSVMANSFIGMSVFCFPIIITAYMLVYEITWRVELNNQHIIIKKLCFKKEYAVSQITDANEGYSAAHRTIRLQLLFCDGYHIDIRSDYVNYSRFRKKLLEKRSIRQYR